MWLPRCTVWKIDADFNPKLLTSLLWYLREKAHDVRDPDFIAGITFQTPDTTQLMQIQLDDGFFSPNLNHSQQHDALEKLPKECLQWCSTSPLPDKKLRLKRIPK